MASYARAGVPKILLMSVVATAVAAGDSVSEDEALRRFRDESPFAQRIALIERSATARGEAEARPPNPSIAYQYEDALEVRDEFLTVQQQIPITGRRSLARESSAAAAKAEAMAAKGDLLAREVELRLAFHAILYRERELALLEEGSSRLAGIVEILTQREDAGESSGYDRLRSEQELTDVQLAVSRARGEAAIERERFASFFEATHAMADIRLEGSLLAGRPIPDSDAAVAHALARRADLAALRATGVRYEMERQAARRDRFPEPTLLAGFKRVTAPAAEDTGFVASIAVPIPLFDSGKKTAERAEIDRDRAALEAGLLERTIAAEVRAAVARERAAREAAAVHGDSMASKAEEIRRIAQISYDGGERGILELLDAHRVSLAAEMRLLSLQYEAKRAEIETDGAMGTEVAP